MNRVRIWLTHAPALVRLWRLYARARNYTCGPLTPCDECRNEMYYRDLRDYCEEFGRELIVCPSCFEALTLREEAEATR